MFFKYNLWELLNDGFSEIRISRNVFISTIFHLFFPLLISFILILFRLFWDNEIISSMISSISIFSGLLFSVIFILLENYSKRKEKITNNSSEEMIKYVDRYKIFVNQITTMILFSITIAMISIIFLILFLMILKIKVNDIEYEYIKEQLEYYKEVKVKILFILQSLSIVMLFNYFLVVVNLVKEIYAMVYDSINSK